MKNTRNDEVASVVLAAGYGFIRQGVPKVVESVSGIKNTPMVSVPVSLLASLYGHVTVVINPVHGGEIKRVLANEGMQSVEYVCQPSRTGTADALRLCLPGLTARGAKYAVIIYGDMPFWQPQSIKSLTESHLFTQAKITMFAVKLNGEDCPDMIKNFGRILRDGTGQIVGVKEPYQMTLEDLKKAHYVNPSAWVIDLEWFDKNYHLLPEHGKGDGFSAEFWLPDLVTIAHEQNVVVSSIPLIDYRQAVGVNTPDELDQARNLWDRLPDLHK